MLRQPAAFRYRASAFLKRQQKGVAQEGIVVTRTGIPFTRRNLGNGAMERQRQGGWVMSHVTISAA
jgi:hypothetical protein